MVLSTGFACRLLVHSTGLYRGATIACRKGTLSMLALPRELSIHPLAFLGVYGLGSSPTGFMCSIGRESKTASQAGPVRHGHLKFLSGLVGAYIVRCFLRALNGTAGITH